MTDPVTAPRSTLWPVLHYDRTVEAVQFLTEVLAFEADVVARDAEGEVTHAELVVSGAGTLVLGSTKHSGGVHEAMRPGTSALYVVAATSEAVDAVAARVAESGTGFVVEPAGSTRFGNGAEAYACTVADPEGNLWTFGTYRGGQRPAQT